MTNNFKCEVPYEIYFGNSNIPSIDWRSEGWDSDSQILDAITNDIGVIGVRKYETYKEEDVEIYFDSEESRTMFILRFL